MIYGYTVLLIEEIGHGQPWWDEYYKTKEYKPIETKLFNSEEERDKQYENAKIRHDRKLIYDEVIIVKFQTEGELK